MKDTTYPAITNARPIPTNVKRGQRLSPVVVTPVVTFARSSAGVVLPRKSISLCFAGYCKFDLGTCPESPIQALSSSLESGTREAFKDIRLPVASLFHVS